MYAGSLCRGDEYITFPSLLHQNQMGRQKVDWHHGNLEHRITGGLEMLATRLWQLVRKTCVFFFRGISGKMLINKAEKGSLDWGKDVRINLRVLNHLWLWGKLSLSFSASS